MLGLGIGLILALEIDVHGGIRTHDPLLARHYVARMFKTTVRMSFWYNGVTHKEGGGMWHELNDSNAL